MKAQVTFLAAAVLAWAALALPAGAQHSAGPTSKILALEAKWNDAYQKRDIVAMNALLADDFIITVEDGATFSKAGYIAHIGEPGTRVDVSEISDAKVRVRGNTAVVTGAYHEKGSSKGQPYEFHDRFTDVWTNVGGQWQLLASHYSIPVKE